MYKHKYIKYKTKYYNLLKKQKPDDENDNQELKHITKPIIGPKKITIVLKPFLVLNGEFTNSYLTGINKIDNIIEQRIANDYTKIKGILPFYYESLFYKYGSEKFGLKEDMVEKNIGIKILDYKFENGLIYLTVSKSNNNGFNKADYTAIKISFDPYDFGPDGYMIQDIVIFDWGETQQISNKHKNNLNNAEEPIAELVVEVVDIIPHLR
jgi:hypothetical protein